jgi:AraC family transcriptional regulator, transcriptional activator of pobA
MNKKKEEIKNYSLPSFYHEHKSDVVESDFGLDNTAELIENGFGLYSSNGSKPRIGPIKSNFFRLGLMKRGSAHLDCGLETYIFKPDNIYFTFPGQIFCLKDKDADYFAYYMLFTEEFMSEIITHKNLGDQFPFFNYASVQQIHLNKAEVIEVEGLIFKINYEIKNRQSDIKQVIQLYLQLILIVANRSYARQQLGTKENNSMDSVLVRNFKKLVSQHFILKRNISDYAFLLNISADHLNKTLKTQTDKTAHQLIQEMLLIESKALLLHSELSVAEIAWHLEFTDPSHFNKFFRKLTSLTPLTYRNGNLAG